MQFPNSPGGLPNLTRIRNPQIIGKGASSPPPSSFIWNPSDKGANITLSNGNLTATGAGTSMSVRGTTSHTIGKFYFELLITAPDTNMLCGVSSASPSMSSGFWTQTGGYGFLSNGTMLTNGSTLGYGSAVTFASGAIAGIAVDLTLGQFYLAVANVWQNGGNPATATNPGPIALATATAYFPAFGGTGGSSAIVQTVNTYTPPLGFSAW